MFADKFMASQLLEHLQLGRLELNYLRSMKAVLTLGAYPELCDYMGLRTRFPYSLYKKLMALHVMMKVVHPERWFLIDE